jgi:NADP-reducing hydrogenase subunit HndC
VVCNADEGDPGAFMDRSILEGDPHSCARSYGHLRLLHRRYKGLIYIRAEYPLAIHRLKIAIDQAREYGLLAKDILKRISTLMWKCDTAPAHLFAAKKPR